jgi:hypothetical protein
MTTEPRAEGLRGALAKEVARALTLLGINGNQPNESYAVYIADYLTGGAIDPNLWVYLPRDAATPRAEGLLDELALYDIHSVADLNIAIAAWKAATPPAEGLTRVERPKSMWHGEHQCRECGLHWDAATPRAEGLLDELALYDIHSVADLNIAIAAWKAATPPAEGLAQRLSDCEDALSTVEAAYERDAATPPAEGLEPNVGRAIAAMFSLTSVRVQWDDMAAVLHAALAPEPPGG